MKKKQLWKAMGKRVLGMFLLVSLIAGRSTQAAGVRRETHSHDMSVECGHDASLDYLALTGDADGKLYINGTEATISNCILRRVRR